jgi:hypothetical protein
VPLPRLIIVGVLMLAVTFVASQGMAATRFEYTLAAVFLVAVFIFVFVRTEAGLYLVLFSMLLSPEFSVGGGVLAERRQIVLRLEDLLLVVIAFSWLAKTALNKEMGLVVKTPLNRFILFYVVSCVVATLLGYLTGTVKTAAGFFYVLKYVEYFIVYYMTVNNVRDRTHARRLVLTAFVTAAVVSVVAMAQVPSGGRVSAPFEGEVGEPNTLGGYLIFMGALAAGIALESGRFKIRLWSTGLLGLMGVPLLFTLSRASYLAVVPTIVVLAVLSSRRRLILMCLGLAVLTAPFVLPAVLPKPVVKRVLYTFEPERGQATVRVGKVAFDPSTSERLIAFEQAFQGWLHRPILGFGVTGFRFMDAQYARTLVETGIIGFAAFVALLWAVLKSGLASLAALSDVEERGLALGFVAGTVGLCVHAIGSNTFIIVRIMEPFWFFAGVMMLLPSLPASAVPATPPRPTPALRYSV